MTIFLDEEKLMKTVPSVFASGGSEHTSSKYGFIPTINTIRALGDAGFYPVSAKQSGTRIEGRESFVKHMIRFRRAGELEMGGMFPEVVLINSHDGTTSYQLRAGIYRLVCMNGLIVGDESYTLRVKHQGGDIINRVVNGALELTEQFPSTIGIAQRWKEIELSPTVRLQYAERASKLKWMNEEVDVKPEALLIPRRAEDKKTDLWTTFNTVQENVMRGGLRYSYRNPEGMLKRSTTRQVKSVHENQRVNIGLWSLSKELAEVMA